MTFFGRYKVPNCTQQLDDKHPIIRFHKPTQEQFHNYNKAIQWHKHKFTDNTQTLQERMLKFMRSIEQAAKNIFDVIDQKQKQSYITADTWKLIEQRQQLHTEGKEEEVPKLTNKIKKNSG